MLHTGDFPELVERRQLDSPTTSPQRRGGLLVTQTLANALDYADRLATTYDMLPISSELLGLALLAERNSGATRTMTEGTVLTYIDLFDLVHESVLPVELATSSLFPPWNRVSRELTSKQVVSATRIDEISTASDTTMPTQVATEAGPLSVLRHAVETAGPTLRRSLDAVHLGDGAAFDNVASHVSAQDDTPASAIIDSARDRFDVDRPTAAQIMVAATTSGSAQVAEFCWWLGLRPEELAALAAYQDLPAPESRQQFRSVLLYFVTLVANGAASGLIVREAYASGRWYLLALFWPVWLGYPSFPAICGVFGSGLLLWLVSPLAAGVKALAATVELFIALFQRQLIWGRTGLRLSLTETRRLVERASPNFVKFAKRQHRYHMRSQRPH